MNAKIVYIKVLYNEKIYIIAKNCLNSVLGITKKNKSKIKYEILDEFLGEELKDLKYAPLFDYYKEQANLNDKLFRVVCDNYIDDTSGTGLAHIAPAFGEDDYRVCLANNIINKENLICSIDENGNYKNEIYDFKNKYIFDCENEIIKIIKSKNKLFFKKKYFT